MMSTTTLLSSESRIRDLTSLDHDWNFLTKVTTVRYL